MDNNLMKLEKLIEKLDRIDGIEFPISDQELCERYENLYTGAVNDVLREATLMDQALPITILPLQFEMRAAGIAFTIRSNPDPTVKGEMDIRAQMLDDMPKNCCVVWDAGNEDEAAHWGEVMTASAIARGARCAVVNGGLRDTIQVLKQDFPIFYRYRSSNGSLGRTKITGYNIPVRIGKVYIKPGDVIFGDVDGRMLGTFGKYGVLSFNGNKMITTSGGGALICPDGEAKQEIMFYATQAREAYPYYQHERIGYNYRMSNICAGIGRGQMTVADAHVAHHKHTCDLYRELLKDVKGITLHENPSGRFDSNYWLNTIVLDPLLRVKGQENAYQATVQGAVGGAGGVTHVAVNAHTDCEPNANVEAMRMGLDAMGIESRPLWKPMHKQPVYKNCPAYVNGVSESLFKVGLCLPSGPYVTDRDIEYIVGGIRGLIER